MTRRNSKQQIKTDKTTRSSLYSQFKQHIREHYREILIYILCNILLGMVIHFCYPYSDLTSDTGGYIRWAIENRYGGTRPLGYSKFLSFVHSFSSSVFAVFFVQLIIYIASQLFFYLTCTFFFNIRNKTLRIIFILCNIFFISGIYSTNCILSDNLFLSLTILLISFCIWFMQKPNVGLFISIVITLLLSIMLRYIGLIYPAIILVVYFFALKRKWAFATTGFTALALLIYVNKVINGTEEDQKVRIFSAFGGWQKASNALHIIPHISLKAPLITSDDPDIKMVDSVVRLTYQALKDKYPDPHNVIYDFIWIDSLPLRQAFYLKRMRTHEDYYTSWNYMGSIFSAYADMLIKKYPSEYFQYFLLNNANRLIHPDNEILDKYIITGNPGKFERDWFEWDPQEQIKAVNDAFRPLLRSTSSIYTILWFVFLISTCIYTYMIYKKIIQFKSEQFFFGLILITYIILYGVANIAAAPVNARFLMPVRFCIIAFAIYCINNLIIYSEWQKRHNQHYD